MLVGVDRARPHVHDVRQLRAGVRYARAPGEGVRAVGDGDLPADVVLLGTAAGWRVLCRPGFGGGWFRVVGARPARPVVVGAVLARCQVCAGLVEVDPVAKVFCAHPGARGGCGGSGVRPAVLGPG